MSYDLLLMLPYFIVVGVLVGSLSMIFGIGGGLVIIPSLDIFFRMLGYPPALVMKMAVATSLTSILASTLNVLYRQNKLGNVIWPLVFQYLPFVLIGGVVGLVLSDHLSGLVLNALFILFLLGIIIHSLLKKDFNTVYHLQDFKLPSLWNRGIAGILIGQLSILIGVGGNILFVPYFRHHCLPMKNATAFTVAIMPLLAFMGSFGYIIEGLQVKSGLPPYCLGFVNLPAFIFIFAGAFVGALLGQKALRFFNDRLQARAYVIFLVIIFLVMLISSGEGIFRTME